MSFVRNIADFFRNAGGQASRPADRYELLAPIVALVDSIDAAQAYYRLLATDPKIIDLIQGRVKPATPLEQKGVDAFKLYLRNLTNHDQAMERQAVFTTVMAGLGEIRGNLELIEDNFVDLFGDVLKGGDPATIRSSTLYVTGYMETASLFVTWLMRLSSHLNDESDVVSPFWTKGLIADAPLAGMFVSNNLSKWTSRYKGLLEDLRQMQKRGSDVTIKTGDSWLDEVVHDNQFSYTEQSLMTAGMASPIMMWVTHRVAKKQLKIDNATATKEWYVSKVAALEARLGGMDPNSPDYKRLQKAVDFYATNVTKYEQKIERLRA